MKNNLFPYILFIFLFILFQMQGIIAQKSEVRCANPDDPGQAWADSVLASLSFEEMIGQLMIIRANTPGEGYYPVIDQYIHQYNIGGVTFFGGHPTLQVQQTNHWQGMAKTPLFISIDGEWGPAMRLDSIPVFPYQMTLGASADDSLLYVMGMEVAHQCKRLGIQINFAPVVDINSNPDNPVIHMRSFGENKNDVAKKGIMYMKGMQDGGLIVTAKHFPGHGDTGSDSHYTLPVISHSKERLDSVELYPFRKLIDAGLDGIMIAHLNVPSLEKSADVPSTLSKSIVTDLLREEMGFSGLIVTDALDMKGVTENNLPGEIEVKALKAGNDILLLSANLPEAIRRIKEAVQLGELSADLIRERCRKVLLYKYKAGLNHVKPLVTEGLVADLNKPKSELLIRQLFEEAVTIVKNNDEILPLKRLDTLRIASVSTGYGSNSAFQEQLGLYAPVTNFSLKKEPSRSDIDSLKSQLKAFNLVIISIQGTRMWGGSPYGISSQIVDFIRSISVEKRVILDLFSTPYALRLFENIPGPGAIIISYQDHLQVQDISAQVVFGGIPAKGRLPVSGSPSFPYGTGFMTNATRLKYTIPAELGISEKDLQPVDSVIRDAISKKAFPGCQVWVAKDGKVFYNKSFGYHTYSNDIPVKNSDLYDIASLTKLAASTISVMRMTNEGKLDIDRSLHDYLTYTQNTNKGDIIIREMMAHQARLKPWIPFYLNTLIDDKPDPAIYSETISEEYPVRVAENLFIRKDYQYSLYDTILASPLLKTSSNKYSDLGFYFIPPIITKLVNRPFDKYVDMTFYKPLGLTTTGYLPRNRFPLERIVPTEMDDSFRHQLIHGDVHDPGAAMLGGISGHAGLFSNANDLGILGQMLLDGGTYGGEKYLERETINDFTSWQFPLNDNRRGIGFDKPMQKYQVKGPCCESASAASYGHSGFTGTYIWVDPETEFVYVFLSNRIYPTATNKRLAEMNIRPKIHQYFYDAIKKSATFAN